MIARLRGEVLEIGDCRMVVDVGGVGYDVSIANSLEFPLEGERVDLFIRQVFREDGVFLYGFSCALDRTVFDLLTEVKGCGPKVALSLLGHLGSSGVTEAILSQDSRSLVKATGVGPKLAERILLELKDKAAQVRFEGRAMALVQSGNVQRGDSAGGPVVEALLALGYKRSEAESAARVAMNEAEGVEDQIKIALRGLAR